MAHRRALMAAMVMAILFAATSSADHSWGGYHWARTSNPFTLKVGDNVSGAWDTYLNEAIADWSASSALNLVKVTGGTRSRQCRATLGQIEACSDKYGFNGWLGIAQIWLSGGHIAQAITKVNDSYFNTATYNKPEWRRLVMCQEIAHDFGLDHQDEAFDNANLGSCMDYTNNPLGPPSNERPNAHDYTMLESIYAHLDGTSTVGQSSLPSAMPPAMGHINFEGPEQWGRLLRSNANGRVQIFELDFGRGNKVITHVFWADPERDGRH
jgi:hypothetical protein